MIIRTEKITSDSRNNFTGSIYYDPINETFWKIIDEHNVNEYCGINCTIRTSRTGKVGFYTHEGNILYIYDIK
jgi:hypothetical protein